MALVRWELVQQSKEKGGLGVGDIEVKNAALLLKWWWKFAKSRGPNVEKSDQCIT